ncbi:MAG: glycosyltransferase family 39 protein [Betaproteobacteria bacterium]|nr:glycosyltransferase family 39 protein [Betaproteobacteria bacterium]
MLEQRRALVVCAVCLLWMLPGLLGRDPWKPEEAYVFGVVYEMLVSGNWLVPHLAGEVFLRHPPFYHWTAAMAARAFSPPLTIPDAARLVNVAYGALTFAVIAATTNRLYRGRGWLAPLLLLGCVGIVQPAHQLIPDNALLAGYALAAYGFAAWGTARPLAVLSLGCGVGIAFLSRGIFSALPLVLSVPLLPWLSPSFRDRRYLRFAALSALVSLPWLLIWPVALYVHDASLFREWFWIHQVGSFWSYLPGAGQGTFAYYLDVLPWFAWPVLPFALWALWAGRDRLRTDRGLAIPVVMFVTTLLVLSIAHDKRELFALPLLVPLVLLTVSGIPDLRRGAINAYFWFGIAFFLFFIAVVWFYFSAVEFGVPERVSRHMADMEPGYAPSVHPLLIIASVIVVACWILALFNVRRSPERPFVTWAAGATAFWATLMFLMVGWIDNAKSYRPVVESLETALPRNHGCIASLSLGESQRALLQYFAGIETARVESGHRADDCDFLLVEGTQSEGVMTGPWKLVWTGHRAGDDRERYRLYRHEEARR